MNDRLGHRDRQEDLRERMGEIALYLNDEAVDLMLIAGDFFADRHPRIPDVRSALADFCEVFHPFFQRGGSAVVLSGNHDDGEVFELFRTAQDLMGNKSTNPGDPLSPGRLYWVSRPMVLPFASQRGRINLCCLPYPTPPVFLKQNEVFHSAEEKNRLLHNAVAATLARLVQRTKDAAVPSVLLAHLHIRNSTLPQSLYRIEERDDVVLDSGTLPSAFAYTALGHIHRAQQIGGCPSVQYSGSIERMDAAERHDEKGVVLVDVQREVVTKVLPLSATPIYDEVVDGPQDLVRLKESYCDADRQRGYLRYRLRCRAEEETTLHREIRRLFPRWYSSSEEILDEIQPKKKLEGGTRLRDTAGTAEDYVKSSLAGSPHKDAIVDRLRSLLQEGGGLS